MKLAVGEVVLLVGEAEKISVNGNFWDFNFNQLLLDKNVVFEIKDFVISKTIPFDLRYCFFKIANKSNDLVKLMIFQNKTQDQLYKNLLSINLTYLLNISGLYLYPLGYFVQKYIAKNNKKYTKYKIVIILMFGFYVYLLRFPPVMLKVFILMAFKWFERNYKFNVSRYSKLSITWIIICFINPYYIFNVGFIYSLIAIIFLKRIIDKKTVNAILYNLLLINLLFIPLQIYFDYKIYWISQVQEIFLVPVLSLSFFLCVFFWIPLFDPIYNFLYKSLFEITKIFGEYNFITNVGSVGYIYLIVYYILFFVLLNFFFVKYWKKIFTIFLLVFSITGGVVSNQIKLHQPVIEMLNVGNGNSFVMKYKGKIFMFDAGVGLGANQSTAVNYLKYIGVEKIQTIFISHNHQDHYNQVDELKETFKIKNIIYNYDGIINYEFKDIKINIFTETFNSDENDNSQVIVLKIFNKTILFMGDATSKREARLLNDKEFLKLTKGQVDLLQVGHHGSKTSSTKEFIKMIKPKTCFVSGEKRGKLQFPNSETIETLLENDCQLYSTSSQNSYRYNIKTSSTVKIKKEFF
ncbi:ComEC/Rec2 family competence protein [Spiroplasma chinense]|uniref:ComEC/Rec2 family competence protein n=1 Tax=Spiroplasma chinense TaxID=216932 RepID=UPI001412133F|nr:ComEC/Rec2 family competence protein [Spiroplasma chinense]